MNFRVQQCVGSAVGIACFGAALAGCGGAGTALTPAQNQMAQNQQAQQINAKSIRFTVRDLGVVGANANQPGQPLVLSDNGLIGGAAGVGAAVHAVLWQSGQMRDIGDPGLGGNSFGYGVNESGESAGDAELIAKGFSTTEDFCGWQTMGFSASPTPCVPFLWRNGEMIRLETLGGVNGVATQINSDGAIAGYAENKTIDPSCPTPQKYQFKPAVWSHREIQALPTRSDPEGVALAINDRRQIAGGSGSCASFNPIWLWNFQPIHALLWQNGVPTDLGNLGGALNNFAHDVNNLGQVVGSSDVAGDQTSHAFLWTAGTKMHDLGTVSDAIDHDTYSVGLGIDDAGQVVGVSASADFSIIRAFLRQNGKLVDLNSLVAGRTPLYLMTACSINPRGEIIGIALDPNTGETHAYLATPTSAATPSASTVRTSVVMPEGIRARFQASTRVHA